MTWHGDRPNVIDEDLAPRTAFIVTVPLPCKPPSPNSRIHYMRRAVMVKQVRTTVALVCRSERNRLGIQPAFTKRHLTVTLVTPKGSRLMDADNLVATCKPILDGCTDAAVILDDRTKFVDVAYAQEKGAQLAVRIEVSVWASW